MDISVNMDKIQELVMGYVPKIAMALVLLFVGFYVIRKIGKFVQIWLKKSGLDDTLSSFLSSLFNVALKVMLLFSVASQLGFDTTSFIAIVGALMVGVGMAFNGTLGHIASGVMLMIFKPFKVGDLVTIGGGMTGSVEGINAFNTTLATLDNKRIIIANTNVTSNTITNISGQGTVGVELTFGIGYSDNIDEARKTILEVGKSCPTILDNPAMGVVVGSLGDSSVNLNTRPFCKSEHYFDTMFYMQENVKKAFDQKGISIPFPQMDIYHKSIEN